jgi:hypothetical protein
MSVRTLFHFTSLSNIESILKNGLLCRNILKGKIKFDDNADGAIIQRRDINYIPFHLFPDTAFEYVLKQRNPKKEFVFITLPIQYAAANKWGFIPRHPLAYNGTNFNFGNFTFNYNDKKFSFKDYAMLYDGRAMKWGTIQRYKIQTKAYKEIYMAEAVGPNRLIIDKNCVLYVKDENAKERTLAYINKYRNETYIVVNQNLFDLDYEYSI